MFGDLGATMPHPNTPTRVEDIFIDYTLRARLPPPRLKYLEASADPLPKIGVSSNAAKDATSGRTCSGYGDGFKPFRQD
jgi:hypothetical protein